VHLSHSNEGSEKDETEFEVSGGRGGRCSRDILDGSASRRASVGLSFGRLGLLLHALLYAVLHGSGLLHALLHALLQFLLWRLVWRLSQLCAATGSLSLLLGRLLFGLGLVLHELRQLLWWWNGDFGCCSGRSGLRADTGAKANC
jgi:hypothetical protein